VAALLVGCGFLLACAATPAPAQDKKEPGDVLFSKTDKLTADDEKDNGPQTSNSHRKVYTIKLTEGQAYRIDLTSKDFDTILRLENAAGKQLAFNDDVNPPATDSRILFLAPKTGEYRLIATTYKPGDTGSFVLEVKPATPAETAEARLEARINDFAGSAPAEQKKLIAEVTKDFASRSADLTVKDAQLAIQLAMLIDESNGELAREACQGFGKVFEGANNKQLHVVAKILDQQVLKNLDKIGKEIEITGKTTDGKEFNLKDLKGKVVLVDFWATWCGPCVAEIPNIIEAHKKYHRKGFEVIGVSLDRSDDAIVKFVESRKLPWQSINVEDSKKLATKYGVDSIPHPILVDREGRIASMRARGPLLQQSLERLLGDKK
jgi:thiol-disulfide isomerase/thioredoxin